MNFVGFSNAELIGLYTNLQMAKMLFTGQYFIKTNIRPQIRDLKVTQFNLGTLQHISPENRNSFSIEQANVKQTILEVSLL